MNGALINLLVEGPTDEAVVKQVVRYAALSPGVVYGKRGKSDLLAKLSKYNEAARFSPWLVVVDLDQDAECAPSFVSQLLPNPNKGMQLRVAVRAIEAWLLADRERLAAFLSISASLMPTDPDTIDDPKSVLVKLAGRSRRRATREGMMPREGSGARVGIAYSSYLMEFVQSSKSLWRVEAAAENSDSLRRCLTALDRLKSFHLPGS